MIYWTQHGNKKENNMLAHTKTNYYLLLNWQAGVHQSFQTQKGLLKNNQDGYCKKQMQRIT